MYPKIHGVVTSHLSAARAETYRRCTSSDEEAVALYRWNTAASGAMFETLGLVEVFVRNAIDRELGAWNARQAPYQGTVYTSDWLRVPARPLWSLLHRKSRAGFVNSTYDTAYERAVKDTDLREPGHARHGATVTHDDVLAHVMFGTWGRLLPDPKQANSNSASSRRTYRAQQTIWDQALRNAFPGQGSGEAVRVWIDRLHAVRNRVAHHEPLILTDLRAYHRVAARLCCAIEPDLGSWVAGVSRVPTVIRGKPSIQVS